MQRKGGGEGGKEHGENFIANFEISFRGSHRLDDPPCEFFHSLETGSSHYTSQRES